MEIPDLIEQRLGAESVESAVSLGDEDRICFTPSRTLLYRGEGLIGDESVEVFESNVERLTVSDGRRKTSFRLGYVDREESFSVGSDRGEPVVQRLLQSILRTGDVLDDDEAVQDVYRFSELTIVITDRRLVKHVGAYVWDDDYEGFPFGDVTGLEFEEGSVATQIVLSVSGRPHRFKTPNDEAALLKRSLTNALCEYYEVGSLSGLTRVFDEKGSASDTEEESASSDLELDDSISPLVGESDDEPALGGEIREIGEPAPGSGDDQGGGSTEAEAGAGSAAVDPEAFEAMQSQVSTLTTAVKRQNELLKEQHETIQQLIEELQRRH